MADRDLNPAVFWAKLSPRGAPVRVHPLICHMIDVAVVARAIWDTVLTDGERCRIASSLGCTEAVAASWIAFLAGLHDAGKASPAFQSMDPQACERLKLSGLTCRKPVRDTPHGVVSTVSLNEILPAFGLPDGLADRLATVVGGHHGVFPQSAELDHARDNRESVGGSLWADARLTLAKLLAKLLDVPRRDQPAQLDNASAMFLAGLVSVADWIGSMEELFPPIATYPYLEPSVDAPDYLRRSAVMARDALKLLGWTGWSPSSESRDFFSLFPNIKSPNPVQREVAALADTLEGPTLVVVEAPMGEGKTEAAIFLEDRWGAAPGQRGCYFALPTQATSDQMYGRVLEFMKKRYPSDLVNLQLLHGHASLSALFQELLRRGEQQRGLAAGLEPKDIAGESGYDGVPAGVVAGEWFTYRKRGLLAPFGVGTIDQALLAALQTRHVFVRLFGLAHKTVILDEIHAYDAYMTALLERLLEWLGALGSSVVLLSATLPDSRRLRLVEAYARGAGYSFDKDKMQAHYPRISWASRAGCGAREVGVSARSTRRLELEWVDGALPAEGVPFTLGERLRAALEAGGCAAVICNTVSRAQQVYLALKPYFPGTADDGEPVLDILHARYLYEDRQKREKRTLVRFGKLGGEVEMEDGTVQKVRRPDRAVLVSTQIIEQSLDLDFDLMVTDLAPVDLMLQRSGRLHRHERTRPGGLGHPVLWICKPRDGEDVPIFDPGFVKVYDEHVLLRTWLESKSRTEVQVPGDVENLIEGVYADRPCPTEECPALQSAWNESRRRLQQEMERDIQEAKDRWLKRPHYGGALWRLTGDPREEDAPDFHRAHQALTRLSEPTVSVVILKGTPGTSTTGSNPVETINMDIGRPVGQSVGHATQLLTRSVSISDRRIVFDLMATPVPQGWRLSPLLRNHRVLILDQDDGVEIGRHYLEVNEEIGLNVVR
jgi:CRISPR-associated endonuclease/helicase Cas3